MQQFIDFCSSPTMQIISFFCCLLLFFGMSRKNKKLTRKIDALQKEVVSLDGQLYDAQQECDRLGSLLEGGE